ncbi:hypothetical protein BJ684DRAFT_17191 [Piptocephalis cylindrospora]|uniref:Uncharacterized protein n=1 Tax=Piptocephalis cylindrospora TaxID=1907219 RepID=A0A4P9Y0P7_9FUNG|nr:hypothetical protein BJ684DRAFT_17191 [Piptocephalis cylindrospora]|eukprot:RKP12307.1 hypothetical protein BJ684DRAFT_17191 [Piptocephalis cylindrospora]
MHPASAALILAFLGLATVDASYVATAPSTPSSDAAPAPAPAPATSTPAASNLITHFADGVQDKSAKCKNAIKQLPGKYPLLATCYPLVDLYHTPIEDICDMSTGRKGCFQVTVNAARDVASSCLGPAAGNLTALFEMPDAYRNWAHEEAAKAACAPVKNPNSPNSSPRPCLNTLTDMLLTVQEQAMALPSALSSLSSGDLQLPTVSDVQTKVCSSTCAAEYYTAVNGYTNLAPTVYYAGSTMQPILFGAFRKFCSWAAPSNSTPSSPAQEAQDQEEWMKSKDYPTVDASSPSSSTAKSNAHTSTPASNDNSTSSGAGADSGNSDTYPTGPSNAGESDASHTYTTPSGDAPVAPVNPGTTGSTKPSYGSTSKPLSPCKPHAY